MTTATTTDPTAPDLAGRRRRRQRAALLLGLITTGVLGGILVPLSAHAGAHRPPATPSPTSSTSDVTPQYSRGFHIYNLSSYRMKLVSITGDGKFEGRPADGEILMPGVGFHDVEVQWVWLSNQRDTATYAILDDAGRQIGTYKAHLTVTGGDGVPSWKSETTVGVAGGEGMNLTLLDKPGTVRNIPASEAQAQAATLKQLCAQTTSATCTFTATKRETITGPEHKVQDSFHNASDLTGTYTIARVDTVGITNSVGVTVTAGTSLFNIVNLELSAQYGHEWTKSKEFHQSVDVEVPPDWEVWLTDSAPMIRDTGDFTIKLGNTTWQLRNVYFDSPDPDGSGTWRLYSKNHNGVPQQMIALAATSTAAPIHLG